MLKNKEINIKKIRNKVEKMSNNYYLYCMAHVAILFGQYPVKSMSKDSERHEISFSSLSGLWSLFFFIFHFILAQSVVTFTIHFAPVIFEAQLGSRIVLIIFFLGSCLHIIIIYLMYITYFLKLPLFFKIYSKLRDYDLKYYLKFKLNKVMLLKYLFNALIWIFEASLCFLTIKQANWFFRMYPKIGAGFSEKSWILKLLGTTTSALDETYWLIFGFTHVFVISFGMEFLIQLILTMVSMLVERMKSIECWILLKVHSEANEYRNEKNSTKVSFSTFSQEDIELISGQTKELMNIFSNLKSASNFVILVLMITTCFSITVLVFATFSIFSSGIFANELFMISIAMMIYLCISCLKLLILTNCGESILKASKALRSAIVLIPMSSGAESGNWGSNGVLHLKYLGAKLKFELSGYGYFKLSRSTITSIVSAIITYNIVLVQLQNSDRKTCKSFYNKTLGPEKAFNPNLTETGLELLN